ncbi:MAG: ABC transporter permease [Candidatus Dormibacteraceae bacterium]
MNAVGSTAGRAGIRAARSVLLAALSIAICILLWYGILAVTQLNPFFAKTPFDVWSYVTSGPAAAGNRSELLSALLITLRDAALGYVGGTFFAVLGALVFTLNRAVHQTFLPTAIFFRSVPLVALTPLIALIFGRGLIAVTVIAGIVTFFPTLVNMTEGLRSSPQEPLDLIRGCGGSALTALLKVRIPYAVPYLFASARIAAPAALLGALLAEWLATGSGLGSLMLDSVTQSRFTTLWAGVVVVTVVSILIYNAVVLLEVPVLWRLAPQQLER